MQNEEKVTFKSREDARAYKRLYGGKLLDLGSCAKERWSVVSVSDQVLKATVERTTTGLDYDKTIVIITPQNVAITLSDGTQHNVNREKGQFSKVVELAMQEQYQEMMKYVDLANAVKVFTYGTDIKIEAGVLYYQGETIDNSIAQRIVEESSRREGSVDRYINFFRKLQDNPSYKAVQHTYDFMVHNDLEILPDGNIKAWKGVSLIYEQPLASRGVPNWKGSTISMPRNQVEDNPEVTCSYGLHVASLKYADSFGEYLLEVSVSPTDIVSVPTDYDNQKCRCCRYTVLTGLVNEEGTKDLIIDRHGKILESTETN